MAVPATMKAVEVTVFGGPDVMDYKDVPVPELAPGEVLVQSAVIGVNYADVVRRLGMRGGTTPFIAGMEGAGYVVARADGVTGISDGDAVAFWRARSGSYAEYAAVPADVLFRVPADVPLEVAATLQVMGLTAHLLSHDVHAISPGETVLIHAGAGGVGHILIQIAKARGARVLTTVGSAEKADFARRCGADAAILYRDADFQEEVMRLTGRRGVDAVYDAVGAATVEKSIGCAKTQGTVVLFGDASGLTPPVDTRLLAPRAVFLTRVAMPTFLPNLATIERRCNDLLAMINAGQLALDIAEPRKLAEAVELHRDLEGRNTTGKQLLVP